MNAANLSLEQLAQLEPYKMPSGFYRVEQMRRDLHGDSRPQINDVFSIMFDHSDPFTTDEPGDSALISAAVAHNRLWDAHLIADEQQALADARSAFVNGTHTYAQLKLLVEKNVVREGWLPNGNGNMPDYYELVAPIPGETVYTDQTGIEEKPGRL